jgi:putative transposase
VGTTHLGGVPLMVVMDARPREVVDHELQRSCGAAEALSGVERAVLARFPKTGRVPMLALKTDGGAQFVAHRFQDGCRTIRISLMATRKRRPEDNGRMESWNGHFKQDYLGIREPVTFLETRQVVDAGVVDYNTQRPHSSLEDLTPSEYAERKEEAQRA